MTKALIVSMERKNPHGEKIRYKEVKRREF
jgi:hypothetical protein